MTEIMEEARRAYYVEYSLYQETGAEHRRQNQSTQDCWDYFEGGETVICGLADGQSGQHYSQEGAAAVLCCLVGAVKQMGIAGLRNYAFPDERQYALGKMVRQDLRRLVKAHAVSWEEIGSTFVVLAIDTCTGDYVSVHLGDGIIIGVQEDRKIVHISNPENGPLPNSTWLSTSEQLFQHIRVSFGNVEKLDRIILATDGADSFAMGAGLTLPAMQLLKKHGPQELLDYLKTTQPRDDATLLDLTIHRVDAH